MWLLSGGLQLQSKSSVTVSSTPRTAPCRILLVHVGYCYAILQAEHSLRAKLVCSAQKHNLGLGMACQCSQPFIGGRLAVGLQRGGDVSEVMGLLRSSAVPIAWHWLLQHMPGVVGNDDTTV